MKELNFKTFLFQGDSVTDCDRDRNINASYPGVMGNGYPLVFKKIYDIMFPDNGVKFINRGVSGDRVRNLLERYDEDFLAVKPDFISILIGVNDTWRAYDSQDPTSVERFKAEYEELLMKIKNDLPDAKIMLIEQFAFTAHPDRQGWNEDLDPKRAVAKELAEKYADYFVPMYSLMTEEAVKNIPMKELSQDGVHPAPKGHSLIAAEMMKALGIL